jgi:hypothetical protein
MQPIGGVFIRVPVSTETAEGSLAILAGQSLGLLNFVFLGKRRPLARDWNVVGLSGLFKTRKMRALHPNGRRGRL